MPIQRKSEIDVRRRIRNDRSRAGRRRNMAEYREMVNKRDQLEGRNARVKRAAQREREAMRELEEMREHNTSLRSSLLPSPSLSSYNPLKGLSKGLLLGNLWLYSVEKLWLVKKLHRA